MTDLENNINLKKSGLTLEIKVKHQGQVPENGFSEILDLEYVRFDTIIESIAGIQPEISKVIWKKCMTLSFKVKGQGHIFVFNIFDILDLSKMLESTLRSISYHVCNRRFERSCKKKCQTSRLGDWFWVFWDPRPWECKNRHQGQVCIMYTAGANEGHTMNVCDLEFQSEVTGLFSTFLIFLTSKMLESTPRSTLYHVCNWRYERSCKKMFDLDFQGHAIKIEFCYYHR